MNTATLTENELDLCTLVERAQSGDRCAFGELFERFEKHVFAIALRRTGDYNEAQELTQEVFVQAMQKIGQLRTPECFAGWLRSITHRMAINRAVSRPADRPLESEALEAACVELRDELHRGLSRLGRLDRDTLLAFYVHGRTLVEMSDEFEAPVGTIKRRLHVARKRLARQLDQVAV